MNRMHLEIFGISGVRWPGAESIGKHEHEYLVDSTKKESLKPDRKQNINLG